MRRLQLTSPDSINNFFDLLPLHTPPPALDMPLHHHLNDALRCHRTCPGFAVSSRIYRRGAFQLRALRGYQLGVFRCLLLSVANAGLASEASLKVNIVRSN